MLNVEANVTVRKIEYKSFEKKQTQDFSTRTLRFSDASPRILWEIMIYFLKKQKPNKTLQKWVGQPEHVEALGGVGITHVHTSGEENKAQTKEE